MPYDINGTFRRELHKKLSYARVSFYFHTDFDIHSHPILIPRLFSSFWFGLERKVSYVPLRDVWTKHESIQVTIKKDIKKTRKLTSERPSKTKTRILLKKIY
jgi:hypothetical protein